MYQYSQPLNNKNITANQLGLMQNTENVAKSFSITIAGENLRNPKLIKAKTNYKVSLNN